MVKTNNFVSRFIVVTLTTALLLMSGSRAIPVSALAVGPLADPVYDTEIYAFKDYVEENLTNPQLDIMFFLVGGLAVAQMGAQDAMLISPYPNEENVKEWIINCGIQLYNSVIGLVPEGDYYMGIPSIGTGGQKGIPRQVIKALVAQMMGDAVVAVNYPDLDTFLEENPDKILLPFNADLQLGVNAVFGLHGGLNDWQLSRKEFTTNVAYRSVAMSSSMQVDYLSKLNLTSYEPIVRYNLYNATTQYNARARGTAFSQYTNLFIDVTNHQYRFYDDSGNLPPTESGSPILPNSYVYYNNTNDPWVSSNTSGNLTSFIVGNFNITNYAYYNDFVEMVQSIYDGNYIGRLGFYFYEDFVKHVYVGSNWNDKREIFNDTNLNISDVMIQYYQQIENDYLFDLRGLMGDLVNYVYLNPIWDNIYDLVGNLVVPDRVKVSVDLTPITDLLAPPLPVNMNDIAEYTDNTYLERVKEHARNAGDIFANYVAFWHNCDSDLVYTVFGAAILVLVGAFVGKWGHS